MIESMRGRTILAILFIAMSFVYLLPNFVDLPKGYPLNQKKLNYGLDIQGGAHLVYGVDVKGVLHERVERMARAITTELTEKNVDATAAPNEDRSAVVITAKNAADTKKVADHINDMYATTLQILSQSGNVVQVQYYDAILQEHREQIIDQAIEVIRNRVDEFGVAEPVIAAQGTDRILVQLPGITDPARAKELINKTARLDFRLVDTTITQDNLAAMIADAEKTNDFSLTKEGVSYGQYVKRMNELLKDKIPPNTMISFEKAPNAVNMDAGKIPYLLRTDSDISGDQLEDAFLSFGEFGEPKVSFRFGVEGRRKFGELTGKNVNRQLAIVLDDVIFSAPNIQERIEGEGQISLGRRSHEEAQKEGSLIATALRAGALPAALVQMEERSVGPSLGADSIAKGKLAATVGILITVAFMALYYKTSGMVAGICLMLNVMGLLAILSALGATLTLPGIAGITLTVGMAVDANVIIFERIREELRRGVSSSAAVREGFRQAWSAIFDSNVTTAIAAAVLVYFGSGPVRGFGVTLIAGIVTTMITAVFLSHYFLDVLMRMSKNKSVSV